MCIAANRLAVDFQAMAVRSKDTIFNAAALRCGLNSSDSAIWESMEANYDEIVRAAFEDGAESLPFGRARIELTSRQVGDFGFDDMFVMPNDVIHVSEVFLDDVPAANMLLPWQIDASRNALLVDASSKRVEIEYIRQGQESTWSANFALGVQRRLEAVIKSVLEEVQEEVQRDQDGDLFFLKAGVKGSKNRSATSVRKRGSGRILRARGRAYSGRRTTVRGGR